MRKTGKLYYLTLSSALGMVLSSVLIATWNDSTPGFRLWGDIVFSGFGGTSLITSTLIVGPFFNPLINFLHLFQALIASVDKKDYAVATGSKLRFSACTYLTESSPPSIVSVPNFGTGPRGESQWGFGASYPRELPPKGNTRSGCGGGTKAYLYHGLHRSLINLSQIIQSIR